MISSDSFLQMLLLSNSKNFCIVVSTVASGHSDADSQNASCSILGIVSGCISQNRIKLTSYAEQINYLVLKFVIVRCENVSSILVYYELYSYVIVSIPC